MALLFSSCKKQEHPIEPNLRDEYHSVTATNTYATVPNSNHFTFATLYYNDLEAGEVMELDMVEGNKLHKVGTAYVELIDEKLVVTIDKFGTGRFGILAFNTLPQPKNGNIHSLKEFKHNNQLVIPCPVGDVIYLYLHCEKIQFYE